MFRITKDPSSGSDNLYLIEITYNVRCAGLGATGSQTSTTHTHTHTTGPKHAAKYRPRT